MRNLINACGFVCYSSGATRVACGGHGPVTLNSISYQWLVIVGAIVFSTLQMQDMADQEGDKARNRGTLPLVHGDWAGEYLRRGPKGTRLMCRSSMDDSRSGRVLVGGLSLVLAA